MIKSSLNKIINILFAIIMVTIVLVTIIIDKNIKSNFTNSLIFNNIIYYLLAILLLVIIVFIKKLFFPKKDINNICFLMILIIIPILVAIYWQYPISLWISFPTKANPDFNNVMNAAIGLSVGKDFLNFPYFFTHANNANISLIYSYVFKIVGDWRLVIFFYQLLANVSAILVTLSVKKITNNNFCSIICLLFSEVLLALTWRANLVYTDSLAMLFIVLFIFVNTTKLKYKLKFLILTILAAVCYFVKISSIIIYLAYIVNMLLTVKDFKINNIEINKIIFSIFCIILSFTFIIFLQNSIRLKYKLNLNNSYPKTWQHMLLVGQNNDNFGLANREDLVIRDKIVDEAINNNKNNDYVNINEFNIAINRIKDRGIIGNIKFYLSKLNLAYGDGYFHNVQIGFDSVNNNIFYNIYNKDVGIYYQLGATILQILWNSVLIIMLIGSLLFYKNNSFRYYKLCILAVTLFLLLFEGRSKYLYMFLPVYLVGFGYILNGLFSKIENFYEKK